MDGVLVIDKPAGPTSHDIVSRIRKALRAKKVGHTGTLDPVATGVLPLVVGKATKVARYLSGSAKTYRATLRLGVNTTTLDGEGDVVQERPVDVGEPRLSEALERFVGDIEQIPPMYSAKKVDGKRLYELARKGLEIEREPKPVHVSRIDLLDFAPPLVTIEVSCSAGTYVRVLAQDIGEVLGCGAYLHELRRTAAGPFTLDDAIPIDEAENDPDAARARMLPLDRALAGLRRINVPASIGKMVVSGYQLSVADLRTLDTPEFSEGDPITLGLDGGGLIAITTSLMPSDDLMRSRRDKRALKTERVSGQSIAVDSPQTGTIPQGPAAPTNRTGR